MKWASLFLISPFLILAGCAAPDRTVGFAETRPAPDVFRILYPHDGYTHDGRTQDLALLRASELVLQNGLHFFAVLEEGGPAIRPHTTEATQVPAIPWSKTGLTIMGYRTKPKGFFTFDAAFLRGALRQKYGIQEEEAARPSLESLDRLFAGMKSGELLRLATPEAPPNEYIFMDYHPQDGTVALSPARGVRFSGRIYPLRDILSVELIHPAPPEP